MQLEKFTLQSLLIVSFFIVSNTFAEQLEDHGSLGSLPSVSDSTSSPSPAGKTGGASGNAYSVDGFKIYKATEQSRDTVDQREQIAAFPKNENLDLWKMTKPEEPKREQTQLQGTAGSIPALSPQKVAGLNPDPNAPAAGQAPAQGAAGGGRAGSREGAKMGQPFEKLAKKNQRSTNGLTVTKINDIETQSNVTEVPCPANKQAPGVVCLRTPTGEIARATVDEGVRTGIEQNFTIRGFDGKYIPVSSIIGGAGAAATKGYRLIDQVSRASLNMAQDSVKGMFYGANADTQNAAQAEGMGQDLSVLLVMQSPDGKNSVLAGGGGGDGAENKQGKQ